MSKVKDNNNFDKNKSHSYYPEEKSQKANSMSKLTWRLAFVRLARPVLAFLISLALVSLIVFVTMNELNNRYIKPVDTRDTTQKSIVIPQGSSLSAISKILESNSIIRSATVFKFYVDFQDMSSKLKAGKYDLSPSMNLDDIIAALKKGDSEDSIEKFLLTEGMDIEGMIKSLSKKELLKSQQTFLILCQSGESFAKYEFVEAAIEKNEAQEEPRHYVLEGYLFPDTYEAYVNTTEESIIEKMLMRFDEIFKDEYKTRAQKLGMSIDDVVTLASLIERESRTQDFKKVSAVFHNRLKDGMRLESCASLRYVYRSNKLVFNSQEMANTSRYNTYKYKGLPLGPICNPGKAAIEAALYPDEQYIKDGYLYFCLANPDKGELVFAKTLKEHNVNKAKYQHLWTEHDKKQK